MHYEFKPINIATDSQLIKEFLLDTQKLTGTVPDDIESDGASYIAAILSAQERDLQSCAVLLENGIIIGFIDVQISKKNPKNGFIRFDYIVAQKRRMGHGRKLIDYALGYLRRGGCEKVCLSVVQTNRSAISFYIKNGWTFTKDVNGEFQRMCRPL